MSGHTPGPWVAMADSLEIMAADHKIADVSFYHGKHDEQDIANARLIAAAPELLAELENIANAKPEKWGYDMQDQFQSWAQNRARAAIAKVNGKT